MNDDSSTADKLPNPDDAEIAKVLNASIAVVEARTTTLVSEVGKAGALSARRRRSRAV
jgi:hypothetical protein